MDKKIVIGVLAIMVVVLGVSLFLTLDRRPSEEEVEDSGVAEENPGKFIVKTSPWKPYMYEEDGEYKGISVDVLDLVMTRLGVDYEFELIPWNRALKLAEKGEVEALLSGAYSDERAPFIAYTDEQKAYGREGKIPEAYLHTIEGAFLVRTIFRDTIVFESIEQLAVKGYRIGVNQGYTYDPVIEAATGWNRVYHVTEEESIEALMNGEIDLLLTYKEVGLAVRDEMGLQDKVSLAKGPAPFKSYYFLLFSKNSDYSRLKELQYLVDEELKNIYESGEFDEIYRKYVQE